MRKIAQQAIDISPCRRNAAPLFATIEPIKRAQDAAMRDFKTIMISGANGSRGDAAASGSLRDLQVEIPEATGSAVAAGVYYV